MKCFLPLLLLISVLLPATNLSAQNYRVLQPERTTLYQSENEKILGMRVDSVRIQGSDTIYYLLKNLQGMDYECYHIDGPSWMGDKITIKPNGETIFYNLNQEGILIKTYAVPNESWVSYASPSLSFIATLDTVIESAFLGITDSVKYISFQARNADGQNIAHYINNIGIAVSENYGFLKTFNFFNFPNVQFGFKFQQVNEMTLVGIENQQGGIQNLTWEMIKDNSIGDEIHTSSEYSYFGYSNYTERISRLLDKSVSADTTTLVWEKKIKNTLYNNGGNVFTAYIDTTSEIVVSRSDFNLLPGVAYYLGSYTYNTSEMRTGIHGPSKLMGQEISGVTPSWWVDTCFMHTIIDGCFSDYRYYKGLGGPYYHTYFGGLDECSNALVYYKNDSIEWGTPLDFTVNTTLQPIEKETDLVSIFPNPVKSYVNLEFKGNTGEFRLQIFDYSGKTITEYSLNGENNVLDLANLKEGIYLLRLSTANQYITKKLVKL
jgi:hypothetical protein